MTPDRRPFLRRKIPRGAMYLEPREVYPALARHLPFGLDSGPLVERFEDRFREMTGAGHACAVPHCRTGLRFLLQALDLPPGSQVLMTPITIPDIVNVVLLAGLEPVFVDLAPRTCNMDLDELELELSDETSLILVTHLCGFPTDMDRLMAIADRHGIPVVEDCSQVIGARYQGRAPGLFGKAGVYRLTTLKPLSTFYGAMVVTDDAELEARVRELTSELPVRPRRELMPVVARDTMFYLASHRQVFTWGTYYAARLMEWLDPVGTKEIQKGNLPLVRFQPALRRDHFPARFLYRYSDCQAAIGLAALDHFTDETRRRQGLARRLHERLVAMGVPGLPEEPDGADSVFWRYPVWTDDPDGLRAFLAERYVDTATSGLLCMSREPEFTDIASDTPEAFRFMDQMVFLPMHASLTPEDMDYLATCVAAWFDEGGGR